MRMEYESSVLSYTVSSQKLVQRASSSGMFQKMALHFNLGIIQVDCIANTWENTVYNSLETKTKFR